MLSKIHVYNIISYIGRTNTLLPPSQIVKSFRPRIDAFTIQCMCFEHACRIWIHLHPYEWMEKRRAKLLKIWDGESSIKTNEEILFMCSLFNQHAQKFIKSKMESVISEGLEV